MAGGGDAVVRLLPACLLHGRLSLLLLPSDVLFLVVFVLRFFQLPTDTPTYIVWQKKQRTILHVPLDQAVATVRRQQVIPAARRKRHYISNSTVSCCGCTWGGGYTFGGRDLLLLLLLATKVRRLRFLLRSYSVVVVVLYCGAVVDYSQQQPTSSLIVVRSVARFPLARHNAGTNTESGYRYDN